MLTQFDPEFTDLDPDARSQVAKLNETASQFDLLKLIPHASKQTIDRIKELVPDLIKF